MVAIHFNAKAVRVEDPDVVRKFRDVAQRLLMREMLREDMGAVSVRFLPWTPGEDGRPRFRCQVYAGTTGVFAVHGQWVWWSPVVSTPEELAAALDQALRARREPAARRSVQWPRRRPAWSASAAE